MDRDGKAKVGGLTSLISVRIGSCRLSGRCRCDAVPRNDRGQSDIARRDEGLGFGSNCRSGACTRRACRWRGWPRFGRCPGTSQTPPQEMPTARPGDCAGRHRWNGCRGSRRRREPLLAERLVPEGLDQAPRRAAIGEWNSPPGWCRTRVRRARLRLPGPRSVAATRG